MSIKHQLTSLIISTVILASFLAALHGYRSSLTQLDTVFDQELLTVANIISEVAEQVEAVPPSISSSIVFQIVKGRQIISASNNAPNHVITGEPKTFGTKTFFGKRWRTYTVESKTVSVVVAHPLESRSNSAEQILLVTILPIVIAIPVIAILIVYIIQKSLKALLILSRQLKARNSDDLSEIIIESPPEELNPVIQRLNNLFARLNQAFEREKHLSANAAHELRTPISVLSLTAHNIKQEFLSGNLSPQLINELQQNIERQAHVIEQMIALYRFTPEQFTRELKEVDLDNVLQEVISNNFEQIDANNQMIALEAETLTIQGEHFALYTLFENIVRNSIKYSGKNTQILISLLQSNSNAVVTIEDSGHGLEDTELEKVFERFYRTDNGKTRVKGSGLGLSIASHIVSLHHGEIKCCRSKLGGLKTEIVFNLHRDGKDNV